MKQMVKNWKELETLGKNVIHNKETNTTEFGGNVEVDGKLTVNDTSEFNEDVDIKGKLDVSEKIYSNNKKVLTEDMLYNIDTYEISEEDYDEEEENYFFSLDEDRDSIIDMTNCEHEKYLSITIYRPVILIVGEAIIAYGEQNIIAGFSVGFGNNESVVQVDLGYYDELYIKLQGNILYIDIAAER